jgi:hypothetical protein
MKLHFEFAPCFGLGVIYYKNESEVIFVLPFCSVLVQWN